MHAVRGKSLEMPVQHGALACRGCVSTLLAKQQQKCLSKGSSLVSSSNKTH